jgi:purine-nucleoside/S-methyl-5'-thioadenosine phosphorylase / adenosine deaminase
MAHDRALRDHLHARSVARLLTVVAHLYPLRVDAWAQIPGLVHGFLGRAHGLPPGPFTVDDVRDALVRAGEAPCLIAASRQVHGATVLAPEDMIATTPVAAEDLPAGDAWVSASNDMVLTIRTADCVPILLVAPRARAVAAVHAGWRGIIAGVIEAAVATLHARYDVRIHEISAAIGPAIGGCCYRFGAEHWEAFGARFSDAVASAWSREEDDPTRGRLDLRTVCRLVLERAEIPPGSIHIVGPCTAENPDELQSFRRDGAHAGRQLSYIGWG